MSNDTKEKSAKNVLSGLFKRFRPLIMYGIFGVLTTAVNFVTYYCFYNFFGINNVISTCLAWFISVVFAFVTNKLWVFNSKSLNGKVLFHEIWSFFACRILSGVLDVVIMYITVDVLTFNSTLCKLASNIIVILINYIASKLFVFKNKTDN